MLRKRVALVLALAGAVLALAPTAAARPDHPLSGDRSGSLIVAA